MTTDDSDFLLTTVDNPWSPFTHWDEWLAYDEGAGYYSTSLLARVAITSDELSEADYDIAISQAIDEIVTENVSGVHVKTYRNSDT